MKLENARLTIGVDDRDAVYPVTVDPLIVTSESKLTPSLNLIGVFVYDACGQRQDMAETLQRAPTTFVLVAV